MDRRRFLGATVAGGALGLAGCAGVGELGRRPATNRSRGTATDTTETGSDADPADFVWAEQALWRDERVRENLFAFAGRHDLAVVVAKADAGIDDVPDLERVYAVAARYGVEVWLNVGVLKSLDATAFVENADQRRQYLDNLAAVASSYAESFPNGRIVLWQEAPVGGRWVESGAWNDRAVSNLETLGPRVFAAQREQVAEVAPDVDIGIFVHFPYIVDGRQPETFVTLTDGLRARGALPDFTFTDFYRGWYAKDVGPGPANAAVESLVANAKSATDRPATYLGQAHTIDPQYTPSKQDVWLDLRAALGAGAEGIGWYARTAYTPTERGFDPFVPNRGPAARGGPHASTLTFARDRYQYAYAALRAKRRGSTGRATADLFDCWLVGRNFSFYDHRLSIRTPDEWRFVGDFDGYLDGTYPYGRDGPSVSIFRGLPRKRFAPDDHLDCRIETRDRSDGARLAAVVAMPSSATCFLTESAAATAYDARNDLADFSAGHETVGEPLTAGGSVRVGVDLTDPKWSLEKLVFPNHQRQRNRLRELESRTEFAPGDTFDCWIRTKDVDEPVDPGALSLVGDSGPRALDDASTAVSAGPRGAVCHGLARDDLAHENGSASLELAGDAREAVTSAYAMPYAGTVAFRPVSEAMSLLDGDPAAARTFAIASITD